MEVYSTDPSSILLPKTDAKRVVWFDPNQQADMKDVQTAYLDYSKMRLYPSTEVYVGNRLFYKVNSLGGKGVELDPDRPIIGYFGDSVVQCCGPVESWVHHARIGQYQSYNGGIEGSPMAQSIDRLLEMANHVKFAAVVLYPGWHNLIYNGRTERYWGSQFDRITLDCPVALMTLDPDYVPGVTVDDYLALGGRSSTGDYDDPDYYQVIHAVMQDSQESLARYIEAAERMNAFMRDYCQRRGFALIDGAEALRPKSKADIGRNHWDLIHLRTCAYERIGRTIAETLEPVLRGELPVRAEPAAAATAVEAAPVEADAPPTAVAKPPSSGAVDAPSNGEPAVAATPDPAPQPVRKEARKLTAGANYPLW